MTEPVPDGTLLRLARWLVGALQPLEDAFSHEDSLRVLLLTLGWEAPGLPPSYPAVADAAVQAGAALQALADGADPDEILAVIDKAGAVYRAATALTEAPDGIDPAVFLPELARRLFDFLLARQLQAQAPGWYATLEALGIIADEDHPATATRPGFVRIRFDWDQIPAILSDPSLIPERVYGWGTPDLDFPKIADLFGELTLGVGLLASLDFVGTDLAEALGAAAVVPAQRRIREGLTILLFEVQLPTGDVVPIGLQLTELPAEGDKLPGLVLLPQVPDGIADRVELGRGWTFTLRAGTDLDQQFGVVARPDGLSVRYPGAPGLPPPSAGFGVAFTYATDTPLLLFGEPATTRLELTGAELGAALDVQGEHLTLTVHAKVDGLALVIVPDDVDSFLGSMLGDHELPVTIPLSLSWSSRTGLDFATGAGFEVSASPRTEVLGVRMDRVGLSVRAEAGADRQAMLVRAAAALSGTLGPLSFSADGLGVQLAVTFADGNAGPFDVRLQPALPTGLGLSLDAGVVTGGGFVSFDPGRQEYAGTLELQLGRIGLKAIGLLTAGPGDWSLLLLLYAQIPPAQLGFGFTLDGVGGLIGVQRGVDIPALAAGMKTGAFDDVLFPAGPVGHAVQIITALRSLFPARRGCLTIGPMVDVHWGKPLIITARLAILIQLDGALGAGNGPLTLSKIVVVGQLRVAVGPTEEDPDATVLLLIIDVLGLWDLAEKRYGFLARLRDSSVAGIPLTGSLAVWGQYGEHPTFLLAAGGFNPRFRDIPSQLNGVLDRLGAAFSVGRFDLSLSGYFAVTPATIQAGLDLTATASIGPVGLHGDIGFDVLIYRRPRTYFIADFHIVAEVTYHGHSLAGVKVAGTIEGPGAWHVVGSVSFSILWWDISKSFDESWGTPPPLVTEQVDVRALLGAELAKQENWSAQLPAGSEAMVTLAPRHGDPTPRAHPLGRFVFAQQLVPFGLALEQFGDATVAGPDQFQIDSVTIGGRPIAGTAPGSSPTPVREQFARAQFVRMSDEDRLTRPAFEELDAGVEFSSGGFEVSPHPVRSDLAYETRYLDLATGETRPEPSEGVTGGGLDHDLLDRLGHYAAAGRAPRRATEQAATVRWPLTVTAPQVAAADRSTLDPVDLGGPATTAEMIMEQRIHRAGRPGAQIVESFELART